MVVGLGNPGPDYSATRHNVGARTVEVLASRHGETLRVSRQLRALVAEARIGGSRVALAFPQTFMNDSGAAVAPLIRRFGIASIDRVVVVHDELDLPLGRVKVKVGGGTAGHNGLRSIQSHIHDLGFIRVRIGIGRPPGRMDGAAYVLRAPGAKERPEIDRAIDDAADAIELILAEGAAAAMNRVNAGP